MAAVGDIPGPSGRPSRARPVDDPTWDLPLTDLHEVLDLGLERVGTLLDDEERAVVAAWRALEGPAGRLLARLSVRKPDAFVIETLAAPGVPDPSSAVEVLVGAGLAELGAAWSERVRWSDKATLARWCVQCGLLAKGSKGALQERLLAVQAVPLERAWVTLRHRDLLRRLERAAFLEREPDRGKLVAERLGHVAWPSYTVTGGALWPNRAALLAWEQTWTALRDGTLTVEEALLALSSGAGDGPRGLSLRRRLREGVRTHAEGLLRAGQAQAARAVWAALAAADDRPEATYALDVARTWEAEGQPLQALQVLDQVRDDLEGEARLALHRTGRRLARSCRRGWAPDRPLRDAGTRRLTMTPGVVRAGRPTWVLDGVEGFVEEAVATSVMGQGRAVVRAEGGLLRTLFALLFADAMFLPVPGMLPVPRLAGPLDVGRPAFAARRAGAIFEVLDALAAGEGPERVRRAAERWAGVRLAGVGRDLSDATGLVAAAETLGPAGLRAVLVPLLRDGWRAAAGVPDLLVLEGQGVVLDGAFPSKLDVRGVFVEVKGTGDTLRDGQRVWIDRLIRAGVPVEVWEVRASGG